MSSDVWRIWWLKLNLIFFLGFLLTICTTNGYATLIPCNPGFYLSLDDTCAPCPPGSFQPNNDYAGSFCLPCPSYTYSSSYGNIECLSCPYKTPEGSDSCGPTTSPSVYPTTTPTSQQTAIPTAQQLTRSIMSPTAAPTMSFPLSSPPKSPPNFAPTKAPTVIPTKSPVSSPTGYPAANPTVTPTTNPTVEHTIRPTAISTTNPTVDHTIRPTTISTTNPTVEHTIRPTTISTTNPTVDHTIRPTAISTKNPTVEYMRHPTFVPTAFLSTRQPTVPLSTQQPSYGPMLQPTATTTPTPTTYTSAPSIWSLHPTSALPTILPSATPSELAFNSIYPTSAKPSTMTSSSLTVHPSVLMSSMRPTSHEMTITTATPTSSSVTLQQLTMTLQLNFINASLTVDTIEKSHLIHFAMETAISQVLQLNAQVVGNIIIETDANRPTSIMSTFSQLTAPSFSFRQVLVMPSKTEEGELYRIRANISSAYPPLSNEDVIYSHKEEFSGIFSNALAEKGSHQFDCQASISSVFVESVTKHDHNLNNEATNIVVLLHQLVDILLQLLSMFGPVIFLFVFCVYVFCRIVCSDKIEDPAKILEDEGQADSKYTYVEIPNNSSAADLYSVYPDYDAVQFEYDGEIDGRYQANEVNSLHRRISSDSATDVDDLYGVYPDDEYYPQRSDSSDGSGNGNLYNTFDTDDSFQQASPMRRHDHSGTSAEDSSDEEDKLDFWPFF